MSNEVNVMLGALSNTNAKYLNLKHFVESYNEVFGNSIKFSTEQDNVFTNYELDPSDSVYINIKKIRSSIEQTVLDFRESLLNISKTVSSTQENRNKEATKNVVDTYNKEFLSLYKLINKGVNKDNFTQNDNNNLKNSIEQLFSLIKNYSNDDIIFQKQKITSLINGTINNKNGYLNEIKERLEILSSEVENEVSDKVAPVIVKEESESINTNNLNFNLFIAKMNDIVSKYTTIINELFKKEYKYNIIDNNGKKELEVIFKTNTTRTDNDDFSSNFGDLLVLNYDSFKPIEEHIHYLIQGLSNETEFDITTIFETGSFNFKDKGELLAIYQQDGASTFTNNEMSFTLTQISKFSNTSIVGKYLRHTSGNNSYFSILKFESDVITISCKNKNIKFKDGDNYSVYEDYNLDLSSDFLQSSRNKIKKLENQIQQIGNDLIDSINSLLIEVVMKYFNLMFGERTWLINLLGDKIENFYMGGDKHGEMIRMIQSAFTWLRPPVVDGDYGDETGEGGQRFSTNYDPTDDDGSNTNVNKILKNTRTDGKYPVGILYRVLYYIEIALEWYEKILQLLIVTLNIDLKDIDFNILDEYITGYKNPLSLSVLSPVIKVMRNLINIGLSDLSDWVIEQSEAIDGELNGKSEEQIKALISIFLS